MIYRYIVMERRTIIRTPKQKLQNLIRKCKQYVLLIMVSIICTLMILHVQIYIRRYSVIFRIYYHPIIIYNSEFV